MASCLVSLPKPLFNQTLLSSLNLTNSDILTIYDGDELTARILGQYVGSSAPQKLYSSSPDLTIQFHSDPAGLIFGKGQGFIMNYIGRESGVQGASLAQPLQAGGDVAHSWSKAVWVPGLEAGKIAVTPTHSPLWVFLPKHSALQRVSGSVISGVSLFISPLPDWFCGRAAAFLNPAFVWPMRLWSRTGKEVARNEDAGSTPLTHTLCQAEADGTAAMCPLGEAPEASPWVGS